MPDNPLEKDVQAGVERLRQEFAMIDRAVGEVAPVGKRLLTRREKLMRSFAMPASQWTPEQGQFVLRTLLGMKNARR